MRRLFRANLGNIGAIIALLLLATGVSAYILNHERLRFPLIQKKPFTLYAEFATGQAVIAGQGQTIQVSGVRIGDIGNVELRGGRAIVQMQIDPEYKGLVHTDANALLRPKTGLKDMFIDLDPGTDGAPEAKRDWTVPIRSTLPDVNPDEILASLDSDTRDYLKLLLQGARRGLEGRGADLRDVFARFEPTHRDLARFNGAVALRRENLRHLIGSLRKLNETLAAEPDELAGLVDSSAAVLRSFASEEGAISSAIDELPGTLSQTTDTLGRVERFATVLAPAARHLRPAARVIDDANDAIIPFAKEIAPRLRDDIRPFVRGARPLVRDLRPAARRLSQATPNLTSVFTRLNHLFNLLAYNPNGAEDPSVGSSRQEGYLFWVAWIDHMAIQLFSNADAHGTFRPTGVGGTCSTLERMIADRPETEFLQGLTPVLVGACGVVA
ncbi:MAG: phospholipid/cholesterol/gamma-HCH transport system substrate-binding protein [Solirubrobacteraceae bacterium]|nr:phospholipid/cholesterol/gamma-HCH transport system substrate-binding protein [Solirubrobacteraceae bacterium]